MVYKYGEMPNEQFEAEMQYFISAIFKLLPYKQEGYQYLDNYFDSVMQKLDGFNRLIGHPAELITIMSTLESARNEKDFSKYRKAILDSCGLIKVIKERGISV